MIKYLYALDSNDKLCHIKDAIPRTKYSCPFCKGEMRPRLKDDKRRMHFYHKSECDYESYLHFVAKRKICEWFRNNDIKLSYVKIHNKYNCKTRECLDWEGSFGACEPNDDEFIIDSLNLKELFPVAEIEKSAKESPFIADILCSGESDALYLEIFVKHGCDEAKIKSGLKIIEFKITCCDDIDKIISSDIINKNDTNINIYNFAETKTNDFDCTKCNWVYETENYQQLLKIKDWFNNSKSIWVEYKKKRQIDCEGFYNCANRSFGCKNYRHEFLGYEKVDLKQLGYKCFFSWKFDALVATHNQDVTDGIYVDSDNFDFLIELDYSCYSDYYSKIIIKNIDKTLQSNTLYPCYFIENHKMEKWEPLVKCDKYLKKENDYLKEEKRVMELEKLNEQFFPNADFANFDLSDLAIDENGKLKKS